MHPDQARHKWSPADVRWWYRHNFSELSERNSHSWLKCQYTKTMIPLWSVCRLQEHRECQKQHGKFSQSYQLFAPLYSLLLMLTKIKCKKHSVHCHPTYFRALTKCKNNLGLNNTPVFKQMFNIFFFWKLFALLLMFAKVSWDMMLW